MMGKHKQTEERKRKKSPGRRLEWKVKVTVVDKVYKFNPDWLKDFGWLLYDAENMKMFCKFCKEAPSAMAGSSVYNGEP